MPINPIYPVISDLLPLDRIPSELEGLREALENVWGKVYFKDFRVGQSYHGEAAYYGLTVISFDPIGISIPFVQDLKLVFNFAAQSLPTLRQSTRCLGFESVTLTVFSKTRNKA